MSNVYKSDFFFNVGIDSMGFYAPKYCVDLKELAEVRNVDPNKYLKGLLTKEMRIPGPGEDVVSMAVKAGQNALVKGNINPKEIDAIFLGTETVTYAVKSVSNILSEILDISLNCVTQDVYNACAGATLAVLNAVGMINNGIINKALIIGADICSYKLKSPGEPTQGAAAAALVISKNPRIAKFGRRFGKYSANIYDFYRLPHEEYPVVFGKFSIESYLRFQLGAFDDFFKEEPPILPDYLAFHSPFAKLPLKNIQNLLKKKWNIMKRILLENGTSRSASVRVQKEATENLVKIVNNVVDAIKDEENISNPELVKEQLIHTIRQRMLPTLNVPISIGNMYSASIWGQLIYLLESVVDTDDVIYFGSYGSGATCISGMLKVLPQCKKITNKGPTVHQYIQYKEPRSVDDYEQLRLEGYSHKIKYAYIDPHPKNENNFIKMNICEEGCIVSKLEGLNYCPEGRNNKYQKNLPMFAIVKSEPIENADDADVYRNGLVRVSADTEKGEIVECNLLRAAKNESAHCIQNGFINWYPTYQPTKMMNFDKF
ncbi:MAG: hypothetical protein GF311_06560 [Candidatus Lokiarchaeota archaeon]|nr:hypothetical protein [Candidatus Lokiarchaeota archaeon]